VANLIVRRRENCFHQITVELHVLAR